MKDVFVTLSIGMDKLDELIVFNWYRFILLVFVKLKP